MKTLYFKLCMNLIIRLQLKHLYSRKHLLYVDTFTHTRKHFPVHLVIHASTVSRTLGVTDDAEMNKAEKIQAEWIRENQMERV